MSIAIPSATIPTPVSPINIDPTLPSVWYTLHPADRSTVRFVKPSMGQELSEVFTQDSVWSPASKKLMVRTLSLRENTCIPFHRDTRKEKFYSLKDAGGIIVFLEREGKIEKHFLNRIDDELIIPAGMPHALYCTVADSFKKTCSLRIVLSSRKGETLWERHTALRLQNHHLRKKI